MFIIYNYLFFVKFVLLFLIMIRSSVVKIKKINNFDNIYIESELNKFCKDIVRWAVVDIKQDALSVSVSYII